MTNGNDSIHNSEQGVQDGLTKREYFAAMFMQSILTYSKMDIRETARNSIIAAEALIKELQKQP